MLNVGVVGASGYTGLELIKILSRHSYIKISHIFSKQFSGQSFDTVFPDFNLDIDLEFLPFDPSTINTSQEKKIDILFLAMPHGNSHEFLGDLIEKGIIVIDLSADFRLNDTKLFKSYYHLDHGSSSLLDSVVMGWPELYRDDLKTAKACANPGCMSTSAVLGLYPLVKAGLVSGQVIVDAKTGVSGAGKALKESSLYSEANESVSAYNTVIHRHVPEIESELGLDVVFSPHLIPMNRGILSTIYCSLSSDFDVDVDQIKSIYKAAFKDEPFMMYVDNWERPTTKQVIGTNFCQVSFKLFEEKKQLIVFSAIDNLVKGASGQAVQNMNIMCGFDEVEGLI